MDRHQNTLKKTLLYYPRINIPSGSWLRQALLYWDEIAAIVPQDFRITPGDEPSPDVDYIKEQGYFREVRPHYFFDQEYSAAEAFIEEFIELIDDPLFAQALAPRRERVLSARLHAEKIEYPLFSVLQERGLARPRSYPWYAVERNTALAYMALLAKYLARTDSSDMTPSTDVRLYHDMAYLSREGSKNVVDLALTLCNLLPVPRDDVSIADVIEFKHQRMDELLQFRKVLSDLRNTVAKCNNTNEVRQAASEAQDSVAQGIQDLTSALHDKKLPILLGTIQTLIKPTSPTAWGLALTASGRAHDIAHLSMEQLGGGILVAGSIDIGVFLSKERAATRDVFRKSSYTFLYSAMREGIIDTPSVGAL